MPRPGYPGDQGTVGVSFLVVGLHDVIALATDEPRQAPRLPQRVRDILSSHRQMDYRDAPAPQLLEQRVLAGIEDHYGTAKALGRQSGDELDKVFFSTPGSVKVVDQK